MTTILKRRLNGHPQIYTAPSGGGGGGGSSTLSTNFAVQNWNTSTSAPFLRAGMVFKQGEVPAGTVPVISGSVAVQFDQRVYWPDGSLKFAVAHIRDTSNFSASESRTYTLTGAAGSFNNTGSLSLASIISGHSFAVNFSGFTQSSDGTTFTTRGSGAFTASLAAHAAVSTRVTKVHSGPVCDGFVAWGMATDNTGGAADAHLKTNWHIDAWKNADGSVYAIEIAAVVTQDWWSIANKYLLGYNATFVDGGSTIGSYSGVQHPYNSQWITCKTVADNNIGRRPWIGGGIPTLLYKPNQSYWIGSNLVPPLDLTLSPASMAGSVTAYVPCGAADHRAAIDGTGAYIGRGILTVPDSLAFVRQTALDQAIARVNAHAGLGIPYHYRSNRTRTRPGDGGVSDVANSLMPQPLLPNSSSYSDFTADGLPASVYTYIDSRSPSDHQDGYVGSSGGTGVWTTGGDASHAVAYSAFMYLLEGETFHLEATFDLSMYAMFQLPSSYACRGLLLAGDSVYASLNIPGTEYDSIPQLWKPTNVRAVGWSLNLFAYFTGLMPASHEAYNWSVKWLNQVGTWVAQSMAYQPADMKAAGCFFPRASNDGVPDIGSRSPWMEDFVVMGAYRVYLLTGDARFKALGDMVANRPIGIIAAGDFYRLDMYRALQSPNGGQWNPSTNLFYTPAQLPNLDNTGSVSAATGLLTLNGQDWNAIINPMPYSEGDWIVFGPAQTGGYGNGVTPPGATTGVTYYLKNLSGGPYPGNSTTAHVATTPGGTAISFSADSSADYSWFPQSAHQSVAGANFAGSPLYIPASDSYVMIGSAAFMMARQAGNTAATATLRNNLLAFTAPIARAGWMPWALVA